MSDPAPLHPFSPLLAISLKPWTGLWACLLAILTFVMVVSWPLRAPLAAKTATLKVRACNPLLLTLKSFNQQGLEAILATSFQPRRVRIDPDQKDAIWLEDDQTRQVILRINDLPQESHIANGMALGRERFSHAALSPKGNVVAFAVEGFHGWCGLYDLNQKQVRELAFFFEGKATRLSFSPDGHYLAIEAVEASGLLSVSLWKVKEAQPLGWQALRGPSGLPTEARLQEWSDSRLKVRVRWVGEEQWQTWLLEVQDDKIQSRPFK